MILRPRGFTLLELIIVLIIISILATLGFAGYTELMERAREAEAMKVFKTLDTAVTGIYMESGFDAIDANALEAEYNLPTSPNCSPNFYFSYGISLISGSGQYAVFFTAQRCKSGGKPPQGRERCVVFSKCFSSATNVKINTYEGSMCYMSTEVCR